MLYSFSLFLSLFLPPFPSLSRLFLCPLLSAPSAVIVPDGAPEKAAFGDEAGSEEDLFEDFRSSGHRFGHSGGGGEQLAINEVATLLHVFVHLPSLPLVPALL